MSKRELVDENTTEQGHDLVVMFEERLVSWVLWRWGRPVDFGLLTRSFGEIEASPIGWLSNKERDDFQAWFIVPHDDAVTAYWAGQTRLAKKLAAEVTDNETDPASLGETAHLVDECATFLADLTGQEITKPTRRTIHESLCIGIGLLERDDQ